MSVKTLDEHSVTACTMTGMGQDFGGSLRSLRQTNQERLLALLLTRGPLHRAALARRAELSRTTVSTLINDLMARGLVVYSDELPTVADHDGRAGKTITVNHAAAIAVGINHTFDHIWVHVSDLAGHEVASRGVTIAIGSLPDQLVEKAAEILDDLLSEHSLPRDRIVGVGVGVPAPIHAATGIAGVSMPDQPWARAPAADMYRQKLNLPVFVENCTHLEAVAEARWGAGSGVNNLLYVGLSHGIGCGLIVDGRLYRGMEGAAGELGHMSVKFDGPPCPCGNRGCLVQYAGVPAVLAALRPVFGDDVTLDEMIARAAAGNRAGEGVLTDVGVVVGQLLANLCNLLNPPRIVIGGELSRAGETLLTPIRTTIRRYALSITRDVEIVPSQLGLGVRAGAVGGAARVWGQTAQLASALNRLGAKTVSA